MSLMRLILIILVFVFPYLHAQDSSAVGKNIFETAFDDAGLYFTSCASFFLSPLSAESEGRDTDVLTGSFMLQREKAGTESLFSSKFSVIPSENGINIIYSF